MIDRVESLGTPERGSLSCARTKSLYEIVKEVAGDTWIEPRRVVDSYVSEAYHGGWDFGDVAEREMDFDHKVSPDEEKELTFWIGRNYEEDENEDPNGVHYLRSHGPIRNRLAYIGLDLTYEFVLRDDSEENLTLEEVWEWFVRKHPRQR